MIGCNNTDVNSNLLTYQLLYDFIILIIKLFGTVNTQVPIIHV